MEKKQNYTTPQSDALELHLEGVIALSDPTIEDGWREEQGL